MVVFSLIILPDIFLKRKIEKNTSIKVGLFLEDGVTSMN